MLRVAHLAPLIAKCATGDSGTSGTLSKQRNRTRFCKSSQVSAISYPFVISGKCATLATCATSRLWISGTSGTTFYVRRYAGAYTQARSRINKPCATCATPGPK